MTVREVFCHRIRRVKSVFQHKGHHLSYILRKDSRENAGINFSVASLKSPSGVFFDSSGKLTCIVTIPADFFEVKALEYLVIAKSQEYTVDGQNRVHVFCELVWNIVCSIIAVGCS